MSFVWAQEASAADPAGRLSVPGADPGPAYLAPRHDYVANVPSVLLAPGLASPGPDQPSADLPGESRKPLYFFLACSLVVGCAVVAVNANSFSRGSSAKPSSAGSSSYSSTVDVLYEVEGTATGTSITMESGTGTVQQNDKAVPLGTKSSGTRGITVTMMRGHFAYLSAQNTGASGTITCRITIDGVVVSTNTSSGAYAISSCKGTAG